VRASAWGPSACIYVVLTAILGRDVLTQVGSTIANDTGDPLLTAAILHWNVQHLPWTDAWWQFPIYHPTRDTLVFSEHLLGLSPIAAPIAWITGNPLATYNLTTLLTFPLCGMAMFALVYSLTRSVPGAFLAGLAYAFGPYRISSLPHIQMLATFWAPLALVGLHRFIESIGSAGPPARSAPQAGSALPDVDSTGPPARIAPPARRAGRWRWLALFGACWALQAAANWYTLVLFSVFVALWIVWFVIVPRRWRALGPIAVAAGLAALPLAPIVDKYLTVHAFHGFERSIDEMRVYSADVAAVLCAPPTLTFWGWLRVACRAEGALFPGLALSALFAAAIAVTVRRGGVAQGADVGPARLPRSVALVRSSLLVIALLYGIVVLSILLAGPWRIDVAFVHVSASDVDKPLLIVLAAGLSALLLTLGAESRRTPPSVIGFYLFAAVVTWLLALGPMVTLMGEPSGRPGPFALLQPLPGVSGMRVPARFWLLTAICLSTIAGLLIAHVLARQSRRARAAIVVLVGCAMLGDGWAAPIPAQPLPPSAADAAVLRDQVVLRLPAATYPDIAATWGAVVGGWKSVNGYSGYAPNYYTALTAASKNADAAMFEPFQRQQELHVVVDDSAADLMALTARQPGAVLTGRRNGLTQYRLPRRAAVSGDRTDRRLRILSVRSDCATSSISAAHDGDERTRWECRGNAERQALVADLGIAQQVNGVAYSVGPSWWNVPTELVVETSADGAAWEIMRTGSILGLLIEGGLADARVLRAILPFPVRLARYVRLRPVNQPEGFVWFVAEIDVRGS
jgi:hypothetical protein